MKFDRMGLSSCPITIWNSLHEECMVCEGRMEVYECPDCEGKGTYVDGVI